MSSGRKKDPIWYYFNEKFEVGKKGRRAICKTCGKEMQGLVARLKSHYSICAIITKDLDDPEQPSEGKCHHVFNYYIANN